MSSGLSLSFFNSVSVTPPLDHAVNLLVSASIDFGRVAALRTHGDMNQSWMVECRTHAAAHGISQALLGADVREESG